MLKGATAQPAIRVAAVQMTAELGNVDGNLANLERLLRLAFDRGANWLISPRAVFVWETRSIPKWLRRSVRGHPQYRRCTQWQPVAYRARRDARGGGVTLGEVVSNPVRESFAIACFEDLEAQVRCPVLESSGRLTRYPDIGLGFLDRTGVVGRKWPWGKRGMISSKAVSG
jgi:hypothetical protein